MSNSWIDHVKSYAEKHNISYKESLSKAKESYVKSNVKPIKKVKKTEEKKISNINE